MFDPDLNADYAAEFLTALYREFGDWTEAVGAYHSRTPEFAEKYKARFRSLHASLDVSQDAPSARANTETPQHLHASSLFVVQASSTRPFISIRKPD